MKKSLKVIASILLLGALVFLGGEWPDNTPRAKVIKYDCGALAVVAVCGLYLKREYSREEGR